MYISLSLYLYLSLYIYIYMHICVYIYMYIYIYIYTYTYIYTYVHQGQPDQGRVLRVRLVHADLLRRVRADVPPTYTYMCRVCSFKFKRILDFRRQTRFSLSGKVCVCLHKSNCCSESRVGEITANSYHKIQVFSDPALGTS